MSKRITLLLIIFALVAFIVGAQWISSGSSAKLQANPSLFTSDGGQRKPMFQELEEKAKLAQNDNETAISELADSIFKEVGSADIPADVITGIKGRLIRAEKKFRKNKKGVREENIVRMINELADKFQAPAYAKTSPLQVRLARVELMKYMPSFIAQETRPERKGLKKKVGTSINPEVSPLEAAYIAMLLIHQKMLNEQYQQTPDEYTANLHKWRAAARNNSSTEHTLVSKHNQEKCREMRDVVSRGVSRLSPASVQGLINDSLDTLGIER